MSNNNEHIVFMRNDGGTEAKDKKTDGLLSCLGRKRSVWLCPRGPSITKAVSSEGFLLLLGLLAIAVDPLFFYVPITKNSSTCLGLDKTLMIVAIILRTLFDVLHDWSWWSKSGFRRTQKSIFDLGSKKPRTPKHRLQNLLKQLGKGMKNLPNWLSSVRRNCVRDLLKWFKNCELLSPDGRSNTEARIMAIIASLPLLQVMVLVVDLQSHLKTWLKFGVIFQFVRRILRTYPTYVGACTSSVMYYERIGAAFNLLYFVLAGHALGGFWYLRAVERKMDCLKDACRDHLGCIESSLYCESNNSVDNGFLNDICTAQPTSNGTAPFNYGMSSAAIESNLIGSTNFIKKLCESFWWGINNLSSSGQNIEVGDYVWDASFAIFICLLGLLLFALLIGNLQTYLQSKMPSTVAKLKEKEDKLQKWPPLYCLPRNLRQEVCRCRHPAWQEVREVDVETFLNNIPWRLKKKLKPYFIRNLFSKVKEFEDLGKLIKEELRERARPMVFQVGTNIYQEGHLIYRMFHIVQGKVSVYSVQEGSLRKELKMEDCLGQELLQAILSTDSLSIIAPHATQNIQAVTKVEAFALSIDDFVAIFTKYQLSIKAFKEQWAANVITGAIRRKAAAEKWKKSLHE